MPQFYNSILILDFSGVAFYNQVIYQLVNVVYTSFPILIFGIFNKIKLNENILLTKAYYQIGVYNGYFNLYILCFTILKANIQSIIIVYLTYLLYKDQNYDGNYFNQITIGYYVIFTSVSCISLRILTYSDVMFLSYFLFIFLSYLIFVITILIFSIFNKDFESNFGYLFFNGKSFVVSMLIIIYIPIFDHFNFKYEKY